MPWRCISPCRCSSPRWPGRSWVNRSAGRPGWRWWSDSGGVLVILQPGSGLFEWAALLSLLAALMYATSMLMARRIGTAQPASVMAFYQNGVFLAGALAIALCTHWLGIEDAGHPSISFLVRPWVWPSLGRRPADRLLRRHRVGRHGAADQCLPDQPGQPGHAVRIHRHPVGAVVGFPVFRRGAAVDDGDRVRC